MRKEKNKCTKPIPLILYKKQKGIQKSSHKEQLDVSQRNLVLDLVCQRGK